MASKSSKLSFGSLEIKWAAATDSQVVVESISTPGLLSTLASAAGIPVFGTTGWQQNYEQVYIRLYLCKYDPIVGVQKDVELEPFAPCWGPLVLGFVTARLYFEPVSHCWRSSYHNQNQTLNV